MKKILPILALVFVLSGCSPQQAPQETEATQSEIPQVTASPAPEFESYSNSSYGVSLQINRAYNLTNPEISTTAGVTFITFTHSEDQKSIQLVVIPKAGSHESDLYVKEGQDLTISGSNVKANVSPDNRSAYVGSMAAGTNRVNVRITSMGRDVTAESITNFIR